MTKLRILFFVLFLSATTAYSADWVRTNGPKTDTTYHTVYSLLKLNDTTFLSTAEYKGVYKSTNNGVDWTNILSYSSIPWVIKKAPNGNIFLGTDLNGIYRSTNGGVNFTNVLNVNTLIFDFAFNSSGHIFAGNETSGLYKSTDNGTNWSVVWETDLIPFTVIIDNSDNIYVGTLANGIYKSTNGGATFSQLAFEGDLVWDLDYDANNDIIYACTETNGLNKSTNGGTTFTNIAFANQSVSKFFKSSTGKEFLVTGDNSVYRYVQSENQWVIFNDGLNSNTINSFTEDMNGFVMGGVINYGVMKSTISTATAVITAIGSVSSTHCAGDIFTVTYTASGGFEPTNNFNIELSDSNGSFALPINIGALQSQTSGTVDVAIPLEMGQSSNYKIRVVSTLPEVIGPSSTTFKINALKSNLITPANNSTNIALKPSFKWDSNTCAINYSLQISDSANFSNIIYSKDSITVSTFLYPNTLAKNTKYYWRIKIYNSLGDEITTDISNFTTTNTTSETQSITLTAGWNLISSYITKDSMSINKYLDTIKNKTVIVKNMAGKTYIPSYNINTIGNWNSSEGYMINLNSSTTLALSGTAIKPEEHSISLKAGWNQVSYLRKTNQSIVTSLASITDNSNLLIAKNLAGKVYIPAFNINTIGNMIPGVGYLLYVSTADTLIYPAN